EPASSVPRTQVGSESTDQVRGIVPVPSMEMKGNGTVLSLSTQPRRRRLRNNRALCRLLDSSQGDHDRAGVGLARLPALETIGGGGVWKLSVARLPVGPSPFVLGKGGGGLLRSPWVPQSRQSA